jgi:hypothetical protein
MDIKQYTKEYYEKEYLKEYKKQYKKQYYENNKEYKKQYKKQYYENNKEKIKEYREKNREKISQQQKEYLKENKEKISQQKKQYEQTEQGKKKRRINGWQHQGIIFFDYDLLHEIYINTEYCELCNIKLTVGRYTTKTTKCLDHDHSITDYDNVRNIVCHSCNVKRRD